MKSVSCLFGNLKRTEEGDEERDGEIHAEAVEDGDNDVVLTGCAGDDG